MRTRTDARRQAILNAAYGLFREKGFERTSMAEINVAAGGSKATLYSYFTSKEQLFVECMFNLTELYLENTLASLYEPGLDLQSALRLLAERVLSLIYAPEQIAVRRLMLAEAARAGIGNSFFEEKIRPRHQEIAAYLAKAMEAGELRQADPLLAAIQLRSLIEAEVFEPCMLGASDTPLTKTRVKTAAEHAVTTFLLAYAAPAKAVSKRR